MSHPPPAPFGSPSVGMGSSTGGGAPTGAAAGGAAAPPNMMPNGFPPMMMPVGGMTPMMMQQQMAMMQHMFQQFQQQAAAAGHSAPAGGMQPPAGFPMMPGMMPGMFGMPPMQMPHMMPMAPPAAVGAGNASAQAPTSTHDATHHANPQQTTGATTHAPTAFNAAATAPAPMPFPMAMPMMGGFNGGMVHPPAQPIDAGWVVSQAAPPAASPAATAATPAASPAKADPFSDLSNPSLALRKERFTMPQTTPKPAPPGTNAEEDEEEFADFASAESQPKLDEDDDDDFGEPVSAASLPTFADSSSSPPIPPAAAVSAPPISAESLMTKAFDLFEHHQTAPLVAQVSMSQIASHAHTHPHAHAHSESSVAKGRDLPPEMNDLFAGLIGESDAPAPALPAWGDETPNVVTQAATHSSTEATNEEEEDDEDGFGEFSTAAAPPPAAAFIPTATSALQTPDVNIPTSSFVMPTTSSFIHAAPIVAPAYTPAVAASSTTVEDEEEEEEEFADFASSSPPAAQSTTTATTAAVQVADEANEDDEEFGEFEGTAVAQVTHQTVDVPGGASVEDEAEEEEDFAEFSSAPSASEPAFDASQPSDPFGGLVSEPVPDVPIASLSPPPAEKAAAPVSQPPEGDQEDEEEEEEFADFSSAAAPSVTNTFDVPSANAEVPEQESSHEAALEQPTEPEEAESEHEPEPEAEPEPEPEPKQEADLIGEWGTTVTTKKANPFASMPDAEPAVVAPVASTPPLSLPSPSFDDVFGSLISSSDLDVAPLPDLLPAMPITSATTKPHLSISDALALSAQAASTTKHAAGANDVDEQAEDDDEDGFGTFESSSAEPPIADPHSVALVDSSDIHTVASESTAPPSFAFSAEADALTLPSELVVQCVASRDLVLAPRAAEDEPVPAHMQEAYAMLLRQERFAEAQQCSVHQSAASELATVTAAYKAALAAAEEDDSEDGAQLATAMMLQKQMKQLKASLKADPSWTRTVLTAEEEAEIAPSWSQMHRTLVGIDEEWDAFFSSLYPTSFADIATTQDIATAIEQQAEAHALLRDVIGPTAEARDAYVQKWAEIVPYVQEQLTAGRTFVQEVSHLDLSDPSKKSEFAALLSSASGTFLIALPSLYRTLLRIEFASRLYDLAVPVDALVSSHALWLALMQHVHSSPLRDFLHDWSRTHAVDVDDERRRMNEANTVEAISEARGRHACDVCGVNQKAPGVHPSCAALQSQLA